LAASLFGLATSFSVIETAWQVPTRMAEDAPSDVEKVETEIRFDLSAVECPPSAWIRTG
jgi:hypothetical protein